jgi:hypothetical protein
MGGKGRRREGKVIWPGYSETPQRHVFKVGRNDPCPCGSEKKYKDCHEAEGVAYLEKLSREVDRERLREERRLAKERGVPWYKRMFMRI